MPWARPAGQKKAMNASAVALAIVASVGVAMIAVSERASRSPSALVQDDALWTPRGYGYRAQGYGEPYPAWAPGAYPIPPTQEAAALAYAPEFVPYLRYKEYLENVLDAKLDAKRSERDALASQAYQAAADAARERQAWLDDYEAEKKVRQREVWEKHLAGAAGAGVFKEPAHSQELFSVKDLQDAGDSEAEAMMDPSHPDGAWGHWVDGPRPYSDDAAAPRQNKAARSTTQLQGSPAWARVRARNAAQHLEKHVPPAQRAGSMAERTDAHGFTKGLPSAAKLFKQSLASVDLGEESNSEALMDPSHPSGPWGTWVEPSTSARSVIGEQQYEKYVGGTGYKSAMGSLLDTSAAKATKQILAGVDLGSESYAEALMDPSHPSGPWGTWVEPSTSARSVIGEKQYGAHVSGLYGVDNNTKRRIEAGQQAIAAAVAKSGLNGFGQEPKAGLGGRYGGVHGEDTADSAESAEFGRLLDSSP
jgi:hypothetical protein